MGLLEKTSEGFANLGWMNKGLKIACDNHAAKKVLFIISEL